MGEVAPVFMKSNPDFVRLKQRRLTTSTAFAATKEE
jgi:hypothetical protein